VGVSKGISNARQPGKLATLDNGVAELIQAHKDRPQHVTLVE